jgi:hypothetical protein
VARREAFDGLARGRGDLGQRDWSALYQQHPTTEEGGIIKCACWRKWPEKKPPIVEYVLQSIDGCV